jgi:hypothetical protein
MSDMQWQFETTTGEGQFEITVHVSYEADEHGIFNDNIDKITQKDFDLTGIFCAEQLAELEMEASMKLRDHYLGLANSDFGLL